MLEAFYSWDRAIFLLINNDWIHPWADRFFPAITDLHLNAYFKWVFVPWLATVFLRMYGLKGAGLFLGMALTVASSDFISGQIIKKYVERPRPPLSIEEAIVRAPENGGYSFPSNHATNSAAIATFLAIWIPQGRLLFGLLAFLVGYSRIYCGVHYPSDVLFGFAFGISVACLWAAGASRALQLQAIPSRRIL